MLAAGPLIGLVVFWLLPAEDLASGQGGLSFAGRVVGGVGAMMALWWVTEALPLAATALVPVAVLPILTLGEIPIRASAAAYAHEMVLLFFGGFILGRAIEHTGLHRRVALGAVSIAGTRPRKLIGAFMATGAFLSMWVSNTATAVMMLPIALSVIQLTRANPHDDAPVRSPFATALLLGVAYSTSIGGMATLIGTPPNAQLAAFVETQYEIEISFVSWMLAALPLTLVLLPLAWWSLTRITFRTGNEPLDGVDDALRRERRAMGRMSQGERVVTGVFLVTAAAWISRQWLNQVTLPNGAQPFVGLTDTGIAMLAGVVLFMLPAGEGRRVLTWREMQTIPWGVLLLFGGGLSLARAADQTGFASFVGESVAGYQFLPTFVLLLILIATIVFLTELTSNTATAAAFLPVVGAAAIGLGVAPLSFLAPAVLASSCAFMMPVATPPNAIVFSSGAVTVAQMCRAGLWLNLFSIVLLGVAAYLLTPLLAASG